MFSFFFGWLGGWPGSFTFMLISEDLLITWKTIESFTITSNTCRPNHKHTHARMLTHIYAQTQMAIFTENSLTRRNWKWQKGKRISRRRVKIFLFISVCVCVFVRVYVYVCVCVSVSVTPSTSNFKYKYYINSLNQISLPRPYLPLTLLPHPYPLTLLIHPLPLSQSSRFMIII